MYEIENLDPQDYEKWLDHCKEVFVNASRSYFKMHFENDPDRFMSSILVIKDKSQIASAVRVFHRRSFFGGKVFSMGGIGEVATKEEYRGKGMAGELLSAAVSCMERYGMEISQLGAGSQVIDYYAKKGWRSVPYSERTVKKPDSDTPGVILKHLDPKKSLPLLTLLYGKYASEYYGTLCRSDAYFESWALPTLVNLTGAYENGELCGYVSHRNGICLECIGPNRLHKTLLSAITPKEDGTIVIPGYISGVYEQESQNVKKSYMLRLLRPITLNEELVTSSNRLATCITEHGGFSYFKGDNF